MERQDSDMPLVQWFPGHMAKARKLIEENCKLVDIVLELLDARIPFSSANPMLKGLIGSKTQLVVLNKADLADSVVTRKWLSLYKNAGKPVIAIDSVKGKNIKELLNMINKLTQKKTERFVKQGAKARSARAMIVGIPNVGKSSLINRLAGAVATRTENRPGVTRAKQWIRIGKNVELLDMPGMLWPKFDNPTIGMNLAFTGAINDDVYDGEKLVVRLLTFLRENYPRFLLNRYKIDTFPADDDELLELIGKKRGALLKGGKIDLQKVVTLIFTDFRSGRLGRISLETPSI